MGDYTIQLCPFVNRGKSISKSSSSIPEVSGYTIPLQSLVCVPVSGGTWEIPLAPEDCNPFQDVELQTIRWAQEGQSIYTAFGPSITTTDYWIFECSIPQGFSEGVCPQCFPSASVGHPILVGNLGFNAGFTTVLGETATWRVHRNDLPLPGETLFVEMTVAGEGDLLRSNPTCPVNACGVPDGDCMFGREYDWQTSGSFWVVGYTFFATPTWTGGKLIDYYTDSLGWAGMSEGAKTYPVCDVYGDISLKYKVHVEGEIREVTSVGFAGYAIGTHVLLRKLGKAYGEPFSDSCLGVGEDSPAEVIENEKIGESNKTPFPSLSSLSRVPIDPAVKEKRFFGAVEREITSLEVKTSYQIYTGIIYGWTTRELNVVVDVSGYCWGDCLSGRVDMRTGEWLGDIHWTVAPNHDSDDTPADIVCSYTKKSEPGGDIVIIPWHVMGMGG